MSSDPRKHPEPTHTSPKRRSADLDRNPEVETRDLTDELVRAGAIGQDCATFDAGSPAPPKPCPEQDRQPVEISVASPDRREKILESSAELFARKGVATTTVREIGDAAGVFSGSLYHYFKSKNAIVAELMRGFITDIQLRFDQEIGRAHV